MENGSLTSSQSHLVQHVLHERHCHVTFSAPFIPSSLSSFSHLLTYLLSFGLFISLSPLCFRRCNKQSSSDSVTCNIFGLTYHIKPIEPSLLSATAHVSHHAPLYQSSLIVIFSSFTFCFYVDHPHLYITHSHNNHNHINHFTIITKTMGCLHSKTAHLHSPEDPPTALPDSKKPDPGPPFYSFYLLGFFFTVSVFKLCGKWKCFFFFWWGL